MRVDVSIPASHRAGQIEWARGRPDPSRHMGVAGTETYAGWPDLLNNLKDRAPPGPRETIVFVHGFNTNLAEATYRVAQIAHDYDLPGPPLLFSWASSGDPRGYAYDRDSVLIARNALEETLATLAGDGGRIVLTAHSLGTHLVMETLRQISLKRDQRTLRAIGGVVLFAPDIDVDLFNRQLRDIDPAIESLVIFATPEDRILRLSSLLTGRQDRVGAVTDLSLIEDRRVTVIDLSDVADPSGPNHLLVATSPAAIALISKMIERSDETGLDPGDPSFWAGGVTETTGAFGVRLSAGVLAPPS